MKASRPYPFVSVIIPVRNEGKYIGACLRSLLLCSYPPDRWEIIIADGMSEDETRREVAGVAAEARVPIVLLENPARVTPVALNLAIGKARGEIIIRVDAHAEFGAEYVTRCVRVLEESRADNVGGPVTTRPGADTPMAHAIAAAMAHPFGVGNSAFRTLRQAREVDTVPFGCFRVTTFQRVGLFDERLWRNQDYELNQRIRQKDGRIFMSPSLESVYYSRATLGGLLRQAWANGFWNAMTHYLHPSSFCLRHALPVLFTLGIIFAMLTAGWGIFAALPGWLLPFALLSWLGAITYGMLTIWATVGLSRRYGQRHWHCWLRIFPAFHFVYGAGIAWGWVNALSRRYPWHPDADIPTWEDYNAFCASEAAA